MIHRDVERDLAARGGSGRTPGSAARIVLAVLDEREPAVRPEAPAMRRSQPTAWWMMRARSVDRQQDLAQVGDDVRRADGRRGEVHRVAEPGVVVLGVERHYVRTGGQTVGRAVVVLAGELVGQHEVRV